MRVIGALSSSLSLLFVIVLASSQNGVVVVVEAQSTPKNYVVIDAATFTCSVAGSRCTFQRSEFSTNPDAPLNTIQDAIGGTVFTALSTSDALTLQGCQSGNCYVVCNAGCTCSTDTGGDACAETTLAPTASPTAAVSKLSNFTCPKKTDTSLCSQLMPVVPIGTYCDCYNFCRGKFTSCCQQDGQCGTLECTSSDGTSLTSSSGDAGTMNGPVWGCTDKDRPATTSTDSNTGGSSNSSSSSKGSASSSSSSTGRSSSGTVPIFNLLQLVVGFVVGSALAFDCIYL